MKVVAVDLWPGRTAELAEVAPGVNLVVVDNARAAAAEASDADAVLGALNADILAAGDRLRWVQLASAGVERYLAIPGFAEAEDLVLTNAQRIFAPGGAEHALGMALSLARRLHIARDLQHERSWDITPLTGHSPYVGEGSELLELRGRTMLVIGLGGIGTETARIAHGIGMRVIATRNSSREGPEFVERVGLASELLELVPEADVIVNALPLTPETDGLIDDAFFRLTRPNAFYITLGRGRTTNTDALVAALRERRIAAAGLDVVDPEPLPPDHPLWSMANVIITPHLGGDSDGHMERMWVLFRENLRRFVAGEPLLAVVDRGRGY
ncbi:D-2-hydroxyacid dehydrogenase [Candidatus Palauibacter sp.]|uniref:D-2-hydroxyacid dehydrogenase n=1 Tax=Candidatus Palauibacter sp. TaxID=3101350 RepID=UPI003B014165